MFGNVIRKLKSKIDETEQVDKRFYADVIQELSRGYRDPAIVGKAIAKCNGDESKFDSTYILLRAKDLQERESQNRMLELAKKRAQEERIESIKIAYDAGKFQEIFLEDIERLGLKPTGIFEYNRFKKEGKRYRAVIDYDTDHYVIIDENNAEFARFKFEDA